MAGRAVNRTRACDLYQSHYNPALNKRFMTIQTTDINATPGTMFVNGRCSTAGRGNSQSKERDERLSKILHEHEVID